MLNKDHQHRLDVANFVIWECDKAKHPVTNLKLQRILYLLYGQFWSRYKKELFPAYFVAWKLGPVDLITQENLCTWTSDGLLSVKKQVQLYWCTDEEQDFVVEAVHKLNSKDLWMLVQDVQKTTPWKLAWSKGEGWSIPNEQIQRYFSSAKVSAKVRKPCPFCGQEYVVRGTDTYFDGIKNITNLPDDSVCLYKKEHKYYLHIEIPEDESFSRIFGGDIPVRFCPMCGRELKGE